MTTIIPSIALDTSCNLTITDTTGFYNSGTNPTGFLLETDSSSLALNLYKLSDGYFLNVLLLNRYGSTPIIVNPTDTLFTIALPENTSSYGANFTPEIIPLTNDSTYTLARVFIPSATFYTANHSNSIYEGINMFYTDGTTIFNVVSGTATVISLINFILTPLTGSNVLYTATEFISTCNMNNCYFKVLSTILNINIGAPNHKYNYGYDRRDYGDTYYDGFRDSRSEDDESYKFKELTEKRDILYMTLEVIKYLTDVNNLTQIQKLIEALDVCGTLCGGILISSPYTNCGCNG